MRIYAIGGPGCQGFPQTGQETTLNYAYKSVTR